MELLGGRNFEVKPSKGSGLDRFDVAIFTASCDKPETNKEYATALRLDYPILSDPGKDIAKAYGVVNEERQVPFRWTLYIGKNGRILYIDKSVKSGTHGPDIASKLRELGVPERAINTRRTFWQSPPITEFRQSWTMITGSSSWRVVRY